MFLKKVSLKQTYIGAGLQWINGSGDQMKATGETKSAISENLCKTFVPYSTEWFLIIYISQPREIAESYGQTFEKTRSKMIEE